ncbi:MAG TPA: efflux transporter outer membrane subunit [Stellaceae bacterium]|nr:efflux transporter outer membrane subunit [Stellaceae bacterium]
MSFTKGGTAGSLAAVTLASAAFLLAGCKQGPNFFSPAAPEEKAYTASGEAIPPAEQPGLKTNAAQRIAVGAKVQDEWWKLFRSPQLERMIRDAFADSPTIAQANATLLQAREQTIAVAGGSLPQFDLTAGVSREQFNPGPSGVHRTPVPESVYSVGPSVSYALDVFGGIKRQVEAQSAQADVSDYQLAAAYLTLSGNITTQAITVAGINAQIKTVNVIIADDQRNLELIKTAQTGGTATMVDVTTAQTQLANDKALLPPLRQQLSVARDALTVFVGKTPADWSPPNFELKGLALPPVVPVSLPSALVRQRPDILAAEAQLHVAAARLGVATANLYPNFTFSANVLQSATQAGDIFSGTFTAYNIGAQMAAPIFHGGTLTAEQRAAKHALDASWAAYRGTVISAFGQVADQLQALAHDDEAVKAQQAAVAIAGEALRLARLSYEAGNSTLFQLLDSQRQRDQAQLGLVRAQTQRLIDTSQLLVAMGSGWWNTPPSVPGPEPDPHALVPGSPTSQPKLPATKEPDKGPFWLRWFGESPGPNAPKADAGS